MINDHIGNNQLNYLSKEENGFYIRSFDALNTKELYEIMRARADVFTREEKILYPDADGIDYDCIHVFSMNEKGVVTSYLRIYDKEDEDHVVQMGRVLTRVHGQGLGGKLLEEALRVAFDDLKAHEVYVESQKHAEGFYLKAGFEVTSDDFIEAGIPHVKMRKKNPEL